MSEIERAIDSLDGWLRGQHVDMGRAHAALLVLAAEVRAATARAEAAEADARDVRAWADAVPVEAIRRCWAQQYDDESRWADDSDAVHAWLAQQSEVQP